MNATFSPVSARWFALGSSAAVVLALGLLILFAGLATVATQPMTLGVWLVDILLALALGGVLLWALRPYPGRQLPARGRSTPSVPAAPPEPAPSVAFREPEPADPARQMEPVPWMAMLPERPPAPAHSRSSGRLAASIPGTYEERRQSEFAVSEAAPWSEDPELMNASLSFSPGLHPELRADRLRGGGAPSAMLVPPMPPTPVQRPASPDRSGGETAPRIPGTPPGSALRAVPAPPALLGSPMAGRRACAGCGTGLGGSPTDPSCWGCGRPLCSSCFWRYGAGPGLHRCLHCLNAASSSSAESRSGGRAGPVRPRVPGTPGTPR